MINHSKIVHNGICEQSDDTSIYVVLFGCITAGTENNLIKGMYPHEIHLFGSFSNELSNEECTCSHAAEGRCRITRHPSTPTNDYQSLLKIMYRIHTAVGLRNSDRECRFIVDVSSGTYEYVCASFRFAQMYRDVSIMNHSAPGCYDIPWMSSMIASTKGVDIIHLKDLREDAVRSLRIYADMVDEGIEPDADRMIRKLKEEGIWNYEGSEAGSIFTSVERERRHYKEAYYSEWLDHGWLDMDDDNVYHGLSDKGRMILDMMFIEPLNRE